MGCGVEGEDVEDSGVEGLSVGGIGEGWDPECRFAQYVEGTLDEVGIKFHLSIEEAKDLAPIKV